MKNFLEELINFIYIDSKKDLNSLLKKPIKNNDVIVYDNDLIKFSNKEILNYFNYYNLYHLDDVKDFSIEFPDKSKSIIYMNDIANINRYNLYGNIAFFVKDKNVFKNYINQAMNSIKLDNLDEISLVECTDKNYGIFESYKNFLLCKSINGFEEVFGFHYWNAYELCDNGKFIHDYMFVTKEGFIVGVIRAGECGFDNNKHLGFGFIDVNKYFRNKGLSKYMLNKFFAYIDKEYPNYSKIKISKLSILGEKCNLKESVNNSSNRIKPEFYSSEF